jgi:hypothetical protein
MPVPAALPVAPAGAVLGFVAAPVVPAAPGAIPGRV